VFYERFSCCRNNTSVAVEQIMETFASGANVNTTQFYEILGLQKGDANTPDDIKRAWKKTALRLHPDRNRDDPEAENKFKLAKDAYDVLSDPERKQVYDKYGEEGLKIKEAMDNMDPAMALYTLGSVSPAARGMLVLCISLFFGFFLLFPIFLIVRIDGSSNMKWAGVFSPLFVVAGLFVCCSLPAACSSEQQDSSPLGKTYARFAPLLYSICILIFLSLLASTLDGDHNTKIGVIFIPVFIMEAIEMISLSSRLTRSAYIKYEAAKKQGNPVLSYWEFVVDKSLFEILRTIQWILIVVKVSGSTISSWWVIFLPIWIWFAYYILFRLLLKSFRILSLEKNRNPDRPLSATDEDENNSGKENVSSRIFIFICFVLPLFIMFLLLASRLSGSNLAKHSFAEVLIPFFLQVGLVFCAISCTLMCLRKPEVDAAEEKQTDEENPETTSTNQQSAANEHESVGVDCEGGIQPVMSGGSHGDSSSGIPGQESEFVSVSIADK